MADLLPMFPLSLVAFPGEKLNLHIFEPRYKQLIGECEAKGTTFGIPPYFEGRTMKMGTELRLIEIARKYDDGKLDVKTEGIGYFEIKKFYPQMPNRLYPAAEIERQVWLDEEPDSVVKNKILEKLSILYKIMNITNINLSDKENFRSYQVAHKVGFNIDQELEFMKISDEHSRQDFMLNHLDKLIPIVDEMETLRKRAALNGHFKNVIPPSGY